MSHLFIIFTLITFTFQHESRLKLARKNLEPDVQVQPPWVRDIPRMAGSGCPIGWLLFKMKRNSPGSSIHVNNFRVIRGSLG